MPLTSPLARSIVRPIGSILGPLIGLILVLMIFGIWRQDRFLNTDVALSVVRNNYHIAVAAVGMTFVLITGGIDLSVGSTMALACVVCAMVIKGFATPEYETANGVAVGLASALAVALCVTGRLLQQGASARKVIGYTASSAAVAMAVGWLGWYLLAGETFDSQSEIVGVFFGILAGAAVGFVNGTLVTSVSLPPFIVTLATLEAVRGLTLYITDGVPVSTLPGNLRQLHSGDFLGMPPNVWIALAVIAIATPVLHYTVLGRYAYAIGSNERTARLCGVSVERWKTACYVIAGGCAGLAGVMVCAKFNGGQPSEFVGMELTVIAAVVIGGTSLFGGEGTIVGSALGVLMLGFLYSGCNIAGISPFVQRIFIGGTIVLAAALDRYRHLLR